MKSKIFFALSIIILTATSCKKSTAKPVPSVDNGINITNAVNSGTLFQKWIINDDDSEKQKITQTSQVFENKTDPELTFEKNGTYLLSYTDSHSHKSFSETGTWFADTKLNAIVLKGGPSEYTFTINTLNEEDLVLTHMI